jgi:soluble lytic murein transglycosylase-like protein
MRITAIGLILVTFGVIFDFTALHHSNTLLPLPNNPAARLQPAAQSAVNPQAIIQSAAQKNNVSAAFVKSIVAAESNFNPNAISAKGAIGLMQLMPETAHEFGADPSNPEQNVDAGTRYLGSLLQRYHKYRDGLSRAIAAYNAGPTMVDRYRGIPPFRETRTYVSRVLAYFRQYKNEPAVTQTAGVLYGPRSGASAAD